MRLKLILAFAACLLFTDAAVWSQEDEDEKELPTVAKMSEDWKAFPGYFDFYWDEKQGKIWLAIDRWDEFLYVQSLATGLGSNPVGLDRGQLGTERVVRFKRVGPRVILEQKNLRYRALSDNPAEQKAVDESFADSVLAGFDVAAQDREGRVLIDLTPFIMADAHDVVGRLKSSDQGTFRLDAERSYPYLPRTKAFPKNCEFEAALTFVSDEPGSQVRETAATPGSMTLRQHHSFVQLPDDGYRPRVFDPRVGTFKLSYADYASPIGDPLWNHVVTRHRLKKQFPDRNPSPPEEPIVYYVDTGAPLEVKQALIEGARWWNAAFEAAGYVDAFQVRELPPDADPLDVRYNVIQWVHRSTRGWSYGQSVIDPRTGEIIKGHVLLGSLRVHQDHLLMRGLMADSLVDVAGHQCDCCGLGGLPHDTVIARMATESDPTKVALARIRQLSAHEVGHTLGFSHNFAASTYGDRASVMDYPAPRVRITEGGALDLSDAYGVGVGAWDRMVVNYAYRDFESAEAEVQGLSEIVAGAIDEGLHYLSDNDARPSGAAHPLANLWDNGSDPIDQLEHVLKVRQIALSRFDGSKLGKGRPRAELELLFVPLYLHHRYQVEATAKLVGGAYYNYGVAGDKLAEVRLVPIDQQQAALDILLETVDSSALVISPELQRKFAPPSFRVLQDRERFEGRTSPLFDPLSAAETAAEMTIHSILQRQRLARLNAQSREGWGIPQVMDIVVQRTWASPPADSLAERAVQRVVNSVVLGRLLELARNPGAADSVRANSERAMLQITGVIQSQLAEADNDVDAQVHLQYSASEIGRYFSRTSESTQPTRGVDPPPGSPIGDR